MLILVQGTETEDRRQFIYWHKGRQNVPLCHNAMRRQIECPVHMYKSLFFAM